MHCFGAFQKEGSVLPTLRDPLRTAEVDINEIGHVFNEFRSSKKVMRIVGAELNGQWTVGLTDVERKVNVLFDWTSLEDRPGAKHFASVVGIIDEESCVDHR